MDKFLLKVQDDIAKTESDLKKIQAVLERLGDNSYFTSSNLNEYEQIYIVTSHESNSQLYYVVLDYVERCLKELDDLTNEINLHKNNVAKPIDNPLC